MGYPDTYPSLTSLDHPDTYPSLTTLGHPGTYPSVTTLGLPGYVSGYDHPGGTRGPTRIGSKQPGPVPAYIPEYAKSMFHIPDLQ